MNRFTFVTPLGTASLAELLQAWLLRDISRPSLNPISTHQLAAIKLWISRELNLELDDVIVKMNGIPVL